MRARMAAKSSAARGRFTAFPPFRLSNLDGREIVCWPAVRPSVVGLIIRSKPWPDLGFRAERYRVASPGGAVVRSLISGYTPLLCAEVRELLSLGYPLPRRDRDRGRRLGSRSSGVGGLAGGVGAGAIGPNFARIPRKVRRRGDSG